MELRKKGHAIADEGWKTRDQGKMKEGAALLDNASKIIGQTSGFVTIEASATYDLPPIIRMHEGLSWDYVNLEEANDLAFITANSSNIKLTNRIWLGVYSVLYEYSSDGDKIFIDPLRIEVVGSGNIVKKEDGPLQDNQEKKKAEQERQKHIQEQWAEAENQWSKK